MMMSPRKVGKTKQRQMRVEDDIWDAFGKATETLGTDRSAWLRDAIMWCIREPGAKMPKRPAAPPVEPSATDAPEAPES
jgi:hypothetical protein